MDRSNQPYDLNKTLSAKESKTQIWTLLTSAGLQKYMDPLTKAGVDFHAFCNLTREDMRHVGIVNFRDQDILMDLVRPMATMYRQLDHYRVNFSQMRANLVQSSEMFTASLAQMRMELRKRQIPKCQSLVDDDVPSTQAILLLLDLMQSRINLINRDLSACKKITRDSREPRRRFSCKILVSSASLVLAALAVWRLKTIGIPRLSFLF